MKKIFAALAVLACTMVICACASKPQPEPDYDKVRSDAAEAYQDLDNE